MDRLTALSKEEPDYSDIPELTDEQMEAMGRAREERIANAPKEEITLRLDAALVAHFRSPGESDYHHRINEILWSHIMAQEFSTNPQFLVRRAAESLQEAMELLDEHG